MHTLPVVLCNHGKIMGKLHKVSKPLGLVILAHGLTGTMDGPCGTGWKNLSKALAKENLDVFRFNFRFSGKGWKEFHKMTIAGETSDLRFLLRTFSKKYAHIYVVGESLGAAISILAYNKKVESLVLWYPLISSAGTEVRARFKSASARKELEEKGYVTLEKLRTGEKIRVGKKFIVERVRIGLYRNLRNIVCPTLIISPRKDTTVPSSQSDRALKLLGAKDKKLIKIGNCDHAWHELGGKKCNPAAEKEAIRQTVGWLRAHLA